MILLFAAAGPEGGLRGQGDNTLDAMQKCTGEAQENYQIQRQCLLKSMRNKLRAVNKRRGHGRGVSSLFLSIPGHASGYADAASLPPQWNCNIFSDWYRFYS